jgi:deferrochelatase/peroxidase EfeB
MPAFAGDVLDPNQCHGDLLLQVTATSSRSLQTATERMLRELPQWQVRWRVNGVRPENRVESGKGLSRNPFHFTEGYGNPATVAATTERATAKAGQGEPSSTTPGGHRPARFTASVTEPGP